MSLGYRFVVGEMELPYAPSELKITIGSNNKTIQLINGAEVNILKDPKLREVEFEVELPRGRQYPFANELVPPHEYIDYFNKLLSSKTPVMLYIFREVRAIRAGFERIIRDFEATNLLVSLEDYKWVESANNAYDMKVTLKFKEYIEFGTVTTTVVNTDTENTTQSPPKDVPQPTTYTVVKGDTLVKISKKVYGTGNKWKTLYDANKTVIENTAKKNGRKSSSDGWWIYSGTVLTIPAS